MKKKTVKILENIPVALTSIVKTPITIPPNTALLDARDILIRHRIGRLIIEFDKKPVGIITEKDIAKSVSIYSTKPIGKIPIFACGNSGGDIEMLMLTHHHENHLDVC